MNRNKLTYTSINPNTDAYLSCDNLDDAIRSLALAYGVEKELIMHIFGEGWPYFLPENEPLSTFQNDLLTWCMARHMGCRDINDCTFPTAHYHRGLFDGNKEWYNLGLLNSIDGAAAFLAHLQKIMPAEFDFNEIEITSLANIEQRTQGEGRAGGGPYAFDRLDDALRAQRGFFDYSTPEFFMGQAWEHLKDSATNSEVLRELCQRCLSPVVVKFIAPNIRMHSYVNGLWNYLHQVKFGYELEPCNYTFAGTGESVPYDRILELIVEY